MPLPEISITQFNKIASGEYNAGFIDFATDRNGNVINELKKVNNHVTRTGLNQDELSPERVLEVKEAFIAALERAQVPQQSIDHIRERLGIPKEMEATGDRAKITEILKTRFKPLTRQHVRSLLDKYAAGGIGFVPGAIAGMTPKDFQKAYNAAHMSESHKRDRQAVNRAIIADAGKRLDRRLTDVMSVVSTSRSYEELATAMKHRVKGEGPAQDTLRQAAVRDLGSGIATLFSVALSMLPDNVRESAEFTMLDTTVKLVKDDRGNLSAVVGGGVAKVTVKMNCNVEELVGRLIGRAVKEKDTIGGGAVKQMLNAAYAADIKKGLMASDRTSLTRHFAAIILESNGKADLAEGEEDLYRLADKDYNTGLLVQIAQRTLTGELSGANVIDTKQKLDRYYSQMRKDTANLPDDIKHMLEGVANVPIEALNDGEFIVRAPIVGNIQQHVDAIPQQNGPAPALPQNVSMEDVKDFVADFIFSGDTMVADVVIDQPGELMRRSLSDPKKLAAFAAILKNPDILDTAAAPQIAGVLKAGFAELKALIAPAFRQATGSTLDQAAQQANFTETFAAFFRNADQLPGDILAKFDDTIDSMVDHACGNIQDFVKEIFNIQGGDGANVVQNPYATMSAQDIKADLDGKSLNQILDSAAQNAVPGQVGFFKQVVSTYFTSMEASDKRSCVAAALRYAKVFDFTGIQGEDAVNSAKQVAVNKFAGAVLKGAGPLLHKMMQGLPKDIMGPYADALEDMKQHLAPMPRKIVQAYLNQMIVDSNQKIKAITLKKSLGAASVGEAFLCEFLVKTGTGNDGQPVYATRQAVVKIMRHDAERRIKKEREIFDAAAEKIPGMAQTWKGQYEQYEKEFDFTTESDNILAGYNLYDIKDQEDHPLQAIAPDVTTLEVSDIALPKKNIIVLEVMKGSTLDTYFKNSIVEIRNASASVFEQDPVTGRVKWETHEDPVSHKTVKKPVLRQDIPAGAVPYLQAWLSNNRNELTEASNKLLQATKAWFYNALLGNGQFHGDPHAGNLMIHHDHIGFIDFGNLYRLDSHRADGVNEQHELLRVILGAAFRDKKFILDSFDKLMSAEGKARLADAKIRAKAEAILDSLLDPSRGKFSFNIVYRLQACIVELQKLGLELPPQINCFIQSLVRLSNNVSEINTIVNQADALSDTLANLDRQPPADRDELDYAGRFLDAYSSPAGRAPVLSRQNEDMGPIVPVPEGAEQLPDDIERPGYMVLLNSPEFGGVMKWDTPVYAPGGEYSTKVFNRLHGAQDPVAEAEKLADTLFHHADAEHNLFNLPNVEGLRAALATFRTDFQNAGDNAEAKAAAIRAFANAFASAQSGVLQNICNSVQAQPPPVEPPAAFASAITDILFNNFAALREALGFVDGLAMYNDAKNVVANELHKDAGGPNRIINAIKEDAQQAGGDKGYAIDIGV